MKFPSSKDPDDVLDYIMDWSARLAEGDMIISSTFTVEQGTVIVDDASISEDGKQTIVWISGGENEEIASILNRVITVGGRQMDQTVQLKVKSR